MQEQMSSLWGSFLNPPSYQQRPFRPIFPSFESSEIDDTGSNETSVINIDRLPANYSNSTSETKLVNGHVVEVNKTIHKISSGNNTSGFFSFQVMTILEFLHVSDFYTLLYKNKNWKNSRNL